jgi:hypothetical protein
MTVESRRPKPQPTSGRRGFSRGSRGLPWQCSANLLCRMLYSNVHCHCEEGTDDAISTTRAGDCFAPLAMTVGGEVTPMFPGRGPGACYAPVIGGSGAVPRQRLPNLLREPLSKTTALAVFGKFTLPNASHRPQLHKNKAGWRQNTAPQSTMPWPRGPMRFFALFCA